MHTSTPHPDINGVPLAQSLETALATRNKLQSQQVIFQPLAGPRKAL